MPEHSRTFSLDPQAHRTGKSADDVHTTAAAPSPDYSLRADTPQEALDLCPTQPEIAFTIVEHLDLGDISGTFSGRNDPPGNGGVDLRMGSHLAFDDDELYFDIIPGGHIDLADSAGQTSRGFGGPTFEFAESARALKITGWYDSLNAPGPFNGLESLEGTQHRETFAARFDEHGVSMLDHFVDSEAASLDNLLHDVPADLTKDGGAVEALHALTGGPGGYDAGVDELYLQTLLDLLT